MRVTRLRALGYRIAIDDLGAGYAGLTSFAQLEPEVVKVDMSLVRGIDSLAGEAEAGAVDHRPVHRAGHPAGRRGHRDARRARRAGRPGRRSLPGLPVREAGPRLPDAR